MIENEYIYLLWFRGKKNEKKKKWKFVVGLSTSRVFAQPETDSFTLSPQYLDSPLTSRSSLFGWVGPQRVAVSPRSKSGWPKLARSSQDLVEFGKIWLDLYETCQMSMRSNKNYQSIKRFWYYLLVGLVGVRFSWEDPPTNSPISVSRAKTHHRLLSIF